jgi:hypothetical protein
MDFDWSTNNYIVVFPDGTEGLIKSDCYIRYSIVTYREGRGWKVHASYEKLREAQEWLELVVTDEFGIKPASDVEFWKQAKIVQLYIELPNHPTRLLVPEITEGLVARIAYLEYELGIIGYE